MIHARAAAGANTKNAVSNDLGGKMSNTVYAGINGSVVAIDRATGTMLWSTPLKGSDFVNVLFAGGDLVAATKGELFCLDQATGQIRWHNPLKGYGRGLVTLATPESGADPTVIARMKQIRDAQATAAAVAAG
jgi:outer membrane protein assembly factor BamB